MAPGALSPESYAVTRQLELHAIQYTAHVVCGRVTHTAIHTDPQQLLAMYASLAALPVPGRQPTQDAPVSNLSPSHRWADTLCRLDALIRHDQHVSTLLIPP